MRDRRARLCLLLAVLIIAGVRFGNLGTQSFWMDEGGTWAVAVESPDLLAAVRATDNTPPLHPLLIRLLTRVVPPTEWWLRFPSVVFGLAGLLVLAGALPSGPYPRPLALLLCGASSAFLHWHDQDARMYSLLFFAVALTLAAARRLAAGGSRSAWLLFAAGNLVGIWTHYYMGFIALAAAGYLFPRRELRRGLVISLAAVALLALPLVPLFLHQCSRVGTIAAAEPFPARILNLLRCGYYLLFGYTTFSRSALPLFTNAVLPMGILAWLVLLKSSFAATDPDGRRAALWFILLPCGLIGLAYLAGRTFLYPRHLILAWPALLLLLVQAPFSRWSVRVAFGALLLIGGGGILRYQADPRFQKEDWRGLAEQAVQYESRTGRKLACWGSVPAVARFYLPVGTPGAFDVASPDGPDALPSPPRTIIFYHGYRADLTRVSGAYARQGIACTAIDFSRMKILYAGERREIRVIDVPGFDFSLGDLVLTDGDTTQIRPGDLVLFAWEEALRSGGHGPPYGGYGPPFSIVKIIDVPGTTVDFSLPAYEKRKERTLSLRGLMGTNARVYQGQYTLSPDEFIIGEEHATLGDKLFVGIVASRLIHSRLVRKLGHDEAAEREFRNLAY